MTILKMLAATMVSILIVEIIVFNLWLYLRTKNTNLLNKYWLNNFDTSDIKGLSYQQSVLLKVISITRLLTIVLLVLHIFALIVK